MSQNSKELSQTQSWTQCIRNTWALSKLWLSYHFVDIYHYIFYLIFCRFYIYLWLAKFTVGRWISLIVLVPGLLQLESWVQVTVRQLAKYLLLASSCVFGLPHTMVVSVQWLKTPSKKCLSEQDRSYRAFYGLTSEVTWHHFSHSVLVDENKLTQCQGEET